MDILFLSHLLSALLMIAMPVGLAIYLVSTRKIGWRLWFIGAATFILSQVGHIPFMSLASGLLYQPSLAPAFQSMSRTGLIIFNWAFVGLAAGLFEELFRYSMFRWWAKMHARAAQPSLRALDTAE